ncbi:MAG: sensor domain-containing diguanylate cyclase [Acidimicrobiia bacterium]
MKTILENSRTTRLGATAIIFMMSLLSSFIPDFYKSSGAIILISTALFAWQIFESILKNIKTGIISLSVSALLSCSLISLTIINSTNPKDLEAFTIAVVYSFLTLFCISIENNRSYFWIFFTLIIISCTASNYLYNESKNTTLISILLALSLACFGFIVHSNYISLLKKLDIAKNRADVMTTITKFSREFHTREPEEVIRNIVSVTKQLGYISAAIVSFDRRSKIVEDGVKINDLLLYAEKASSLRRVVIESAKSHNNSQQNDIASAPIWFNSRYSAALIVQSAANKKITDNDSAALELLADQAGRALENAAKTQSDRRAVERLLDESQRDKLTNIGNRRYADMMISTMEPGDVLAMIDIDGLKSTNDRFGHDAGDELLKSVGTFFQEQIRVPDLCARLGGDEFIILLKGAKSGAPQILNRLIKMWQEKQIYETTLSIGMSVHWPHREINETIKAADSALYQAKREGKNRLITAS